MRKKFLYIGLALFAIAVVVFLIVGSGTLFGNALSKGLVNDNLTVPRDSFASAPIDTSNATLIIAYAAAAGKLNMYLFNQSAFNSWSSLVTKNASPNGLSYAGKVAGSGSVMVRNSTAAEVLFTRNSSIASQASQNKTVALLGSFNNGTAYVVLDNTQGSNSINMTLRGVVSYFKVTSSNLGYFNSVNTEAAAVSGADLIIGIAGIVLIVYGLLKSEPLMPGAPAAEGRGRVSKEYIDELYKSVGKRKRKE